MDIFNAYAAWVREVLPDADLIYDHFHLIKLMNDKLNNLRRSTMARLWEEQRKELKGKRFLLMRNSENLDTDALEQLEKLKEEFKDLGTAWIFKEALRNIYSMTYDTTTARRPSNCGATRPSRQALPA